MIEVAVANGTVEAIDVAKNEVRFEADGWVPSGGGPALARAMDYRLSGRTTGLVFPEATVTVESSTDQQWAPFDGRSGPRSFAQGHHQIQVTLPIRVYVGIDGPCRLARRSHDGAVVIEFECPSLVTLGFRSPVQRPRETITVQPTLAGLRTAVSHLSAAIETDTPDKSYPSMRTHPPRIRYGDAVDIPPTVARQSGGAALTVHVEPALGSLLVVAPLVYYLQAEVRLSKDGPPRVTSPAFGSPIHLAGPTLEQGVARLLRRTFYLDCLVRNAGPYQVDLREFELAAERELDLSGLYALDGADRLAAYRDIDFDRLSGALPDWHLSVVMEPTVEHARTLPHLLHRLGLVQRPRPVVVGKPTVLSESVRDSFNTRALSENRAFEFVTNEPRLGTRLGWLAAGTPVDAFRPSLTAFENRFRFLERADGPRKVVVVINDDSMLEERTAVERIYRARSTELAFDVTVDESLTTEELSATLREPADFLHFIGHCDRDGLVCADGSLDLGAVDSTAVQTFFLNACGSYPQGLKLVERGSVAGAVTLHEVLNPDATRVGTTFAQHVMYGFSLNYAMSLARRQSLANKFYTVVGDGTHRLSQGEDAFPAHLHAERGADDAVELRFEFPTTSIPGALAKPILPPDAPFVLRGNQFTTRLALARFRSFLADVNLPVVYEGALYWSTELADRLDADPSSEVAA